MPVDTKSLTLTHKDSERPMLCLDQLRDVMFSWRVHRLQRRAMLGKRHHACAFSLISLLTSPTLSARGRDRTGSARLVPPPASRAFLNVNDSDREANCGWSIASVFLRCPS